MSAVRTMGVLVLVAAAGCSDDSGGTGGADAPPAIMFESFTSTTWSLATAGGMAQLSITDGSGAAACALATDQHNNLGAAGVQIILQLPTAVTDVCPAGHYSINGSCANDLGTAAYVPAGCAFYRKWGATGASLGTTAALTGEITIAGTDASCSIRANVGFFGANFSETFSLESGAGAQPWCGI